MKTSLNGNTSNVPNPINKKLWVLWFTIGGAILVTIAFVINLIQGTITINTTADLFTAFIPWLIFTGIFALAALVNILIHKERFKG